MSIRQLKPYTSTTRSQSYVNYGEFLTRSSPYKSLLRAQSQKAGRNNTGRITVRHQGGGNKTKYRVIDFKRVRKNIEGVIKTVEYDPNRSAFISLIQYVDGDRRYVISCLGVKAGSRIIASQDADIKDGNSLPLKKIPSGTFINNIEMKPGAGAKLVRSAGGFAVLVGRVKNYAQIRLPSGELRLLPEECFATVGVVSNTDHMNVSIGKAGRNRWKGIRPTVRGVAMNPVDHPMGGGEGKTSGGRHPCSPWGQLAKGYKTRKDSSSNKFIITRRK